MEHHTPLREHFELNYSSYFAIVSFITGSLLFGAFQFYPHEENILLIGLLFLVIAVMINLSIVIQLVYFYALFPELREIVVVKILILLSNIPVAFIYSRFAADIFPQSLAVL